MECVHRYMAHVSCFQSLLRSPYTMIYDVIYTIILMCIFSASTPDVVIIVPPGPLFAGRTAPLTLICNIYINSATDTDVLITDVDVTWLRGSTHLSNSDDRVTISAISGSRPSFTGNLTLDPLSIADNTTFTCQARVRPPANQQSFISVSEMGDSTVTLIVYCKYNWFYLHNIVQPINYLWWAWNIAESHLALYFLTTFYLLFLSSLCSLSDNLTCKNADCWWPACCNLHCCCWWIPHRCSCSGVETSWKCCWCIHWYTVNNRKHINSSVDFQSHTYISRRCIWVQSNNKYHRLWSTNSNRQSNHPSPK